MDEHDILHGSTTVVVNAPVMTTRHGNEVVATACLAFEECLKDPGNCTKSLKLTAALTYLQRCAS